MKKIWNISEQDRHLFDERAGRGAHVKAGEQSDELDDHTAWSLVDGQPAVWSDEPPAQTSAPK